MKKFIIRIKSTQISNNVEDNFAENKDVTEVITEGKFYKKDNAYFIEYSESDETDNFGCKTTFKLFEDENKEKIAIITKKGKLESILTIKNGRRYSCLYNTNYGNILIGVCGEKIDADLTKFGGNISCTYKIDINSIETNINKVDISVKESG